MSEAPDQSRSESLSELSEKVESILLLLKNLENALPTEVGELRKIEVPSSGEPQQVLAHDLDDATLSDDIDRIIARLDTEIPARKREMDELLSRLRTTLIRAT